MLPLGRGRNGVGLEGGLGIDGAKGTNVAVAASRAGAKVALVAHVQGGAWV